MKNSKIKSMNQGVLHLRVMMMLLYKIMKMKNNIIQLINLLTFMSPMTTLRNSAPIENS